MGQCLSSEDEPMDHPVMRLKKVRDAAILLSHDVKPELCETLRLSLDLGAAIAPLLSAAWNGKAGEVKACLESPALLAAGGVPKDIFAWLSLSSIVEYESDDDPTSQAFLSIVRMIHEAGAEIDEKKLLKACGRLGLKEGPQIMNNTSLNLVIDWSTQYGFVPVYKYLVKHGATTHIPFADTCGEGRLAMMRYLLEIGALPKPEDAHVERSEAHSIVSDAFGFADMSGQKAIIKFLVEEAGYDRNVFPDSGERSIPM